LTQVLNGFFTGLAVESLHAAAKRLEGVQRWVERYEEALELLSRELKIRKNKGPTREARQEVKNQAA
jgi:hypothetical protein